jgi:predicted kinase
LSRGAAELEFLAVPRLILFNGPPAVGKTTLARRYADDHPSTLVLDLDSIRRLIGGWREDPLQSGLMARTLSVAMAYDHLGRGYDVVVPQFLSRPQFIDEIESAARRTGSTFHEFVLTDDRETVLKRFGHRSATSPDPAHVAAAAAIERAGGDQALGAMYDRLLQLVNLRRFAQVVHCPLGEQDRVYGEILRLVDGRTGTVTV